MRWCASCAMRRFCNRSASSSDLTLPISAPVWSYTGMLATRNAARPGASARSVRWHGYSGAARPYRTSKRGGMGAQYGHRRSEAADCAVAGNRTMTAGKTELFDFAGTLKHETDAAYLVNDGTKDGWLPKRFTE